jgi:outer membrane cobalamin receptor
MNSKTSKLATLLGSASLLTMVSAMAAQAQQLAQAQMAQAGPGEVPEQVLITGSLIRGTAAVGVPVTNLSPQDFAQTGALTTSDLFRTVPSVNVSPGAVATQSGANIERQARINLRGLDTGDAVRTLMMIDGLRFPGQGNGVCATDPSIIPSIALDRIDVLADGASATYGSDAVSGVINIVLKRAYDGAMTQLLDPIVPARFRYDVPVRIERHAAKVKYVLPNRLRLMVRPQWPIKSAHSIAVPTRNSAPSRIVSPQSPRNCPRCPRRNPCSAK